jgi:hypothetical protein
MANDAFHEQESLVYADIIAAVEYEVGKEILSDTLRHVIYRMKGVKSVQGKSMEQGGPL